MHMGVMYNICQADMYYKKDHTTGYFVFIKINMTCAWDKQCTRLGSGLQWTMKSNQTYRCWQPSQFIAGCMGEVDIPYVQATKWGNPSVDAWVMLIYLCTSKQTKGQHSYWTYNVAILRSTEEKNGNTLATQCWTDGWARRGKKISHLTCLSNDKYNIPLYCVEEHQIALAQWLGWDNCEFNPLKVASLIRPLVIFCWISCCYLLMLTQHFYIPPIHRGTPTTHLENSLFHSEGHLNLIISSISQPPHQSQTTVR